ncbi:S41 family peptidase [Paenibacillus yanchengensis]|uniref:S41 family peptidase n=1 Tax=Paenibacillus yanchengensis TaxID=2035833 RepID=A0ABW4YMS7_9BACL
MQFKGRSVLITVLSTMIASVLITLLVTDKLVDNNKQPLSVVAASSNKQSYQMTKTEMGKLNAVLELIETKYFTKVEREDILDGAISGMLGALNDPYSVYMEDDTAKQFTESIDGSFSGIGAEVSMENGRVVIVSPIKGSPAEKAGLLAKDILLSVNGESVDGLTLQEAVDKIRGPKGSKAKLSILRNNSTEPIQVVIVRDDIDIETVFASIDKQGIGVIEIRQFSMNTGKRFIEELKKLEQQKLKGLVIDVRNNPGGVLQVVVEVAQAMMKPGSVILQVEDRDGGKEQSKAQGGQKKPYPIAVVTNNGSASASEILAGALQENGLAHVIGEDTFGKGTIQVSYNKALGDNSLVKLTIAKWLTPKGNWINEVGVKPNKVVAPPALYTVARIMLDEPFKKDQFSEQIRSAQVMLQGIGYEIGREDGYFDTKTEQAITKFQRANKLKVTSMLDKPTVAALEKQVIDWIGAEKNDRQLQEAIQWVKQAGKKATK